MAQKDTRVICNMIWQGVKEIVGEDIIKSEKGLYIHHRSASLISKSFGIPVVKIVLDENPEDPTLFIYISDKYYDEWKNKIDKRVEDEEKSIAQGTFKGKGKGKDKGKDESKGKEKVINVNPHEFIKTSRTAYWNKSYRRLNTFATKHPDEWKEIENTKDRMKSTGEQKGKGKGKNKEQGNKGWNSNSWQDWKTPSEGSTKASEWEWPEQQQQQQQKQNQPNQQWKWQEQHQ